MKKVVQQQKGVTAANEKKTELQQNFKQLQLMMLAEPQLMKKAE